MDFDSDKMYCGAIRRGDIFIVQGKEKMAVVVLQDNILNESLPTVVCANIQPYKENEEIFVNEILLNKGETGLGRDGVCLLHKVITIERPKMVAKKGELKKERLEQIFKALDVNLGRFRDN